MRSVDENRRINLVDQAEGLHRFQASQGYTREVA
jgi:hypothetical protein